jgi:hypothetical protein
MQYLRARYYDPSTGTFNRLDPFAGNMQDPQSLHKYLYVHGDPIQGIDPNGKFATSLGIAGMAGVTNLAYVMSTALPILAAIETGGKAGFDLRTAGLLMIAQGQIEDGMRLYNHGNKIVALTFFVMEQIDAAFGLGQLFGAALHGAISLARNAPEIAQGLLNFSKGMRARIASLQNAGEFFHGRDLYFAGTPAQLDGFIDDLDELDNLIVRDRVPVDPQPNHLRLNSEGNQVYGGFDVRDSKIRLYADYDVFTYAEEMRHYKRHKEYLDANGLTQSQFRQQWDSWSGLQKADYEDLIEDDAAVWFASRGWLPN